VLASLAVPYARRFAEPVLEGLIQINFCGSEWRWPARFG